MVISHTQTLSTVVDSFKQAMELLHTNPKHAVQCLEQATDAESQAKGDAFGHLSTHVCAAPRMLIVLLGC